MLEVAAKAAAAAVIIANLFMIVSSEVILDLLRGTVAEPA